MIIALREKVWSNGLMDGGNGWHVASCGHDKTIINRMMLRFRPIAPKPAAGGSFPGGTSPENKNGLLTAKRVKRKYVRVRNNPRRRKNTTISARSSISLDHHDKKVGLDSATITLQLMPEDTDGQDILASGSRFDNLDRAVVNISVQDNRNKPPTWINNNFNNSHVQIINDNGTVPDRTAAAPVPPITEVVESWVTVEFVTDTCMELGVGGLGCTDVERINNLYKDTCPGFVSDGSNKVKWVNEAYKNMVRRQPLGKAWLPETMTVWLIITKAKLPNTSAFTCLVSLRYYSLGKEKCLKMVPCDVWRMDCGGFAWRLDVKAALSLGLS